jgi:hypothetical protein
VLVGIGITCRIKVIRGDEIFQEIVNQKKSVIFSFWHNRIFFLSYFLYKFCHKKGLHLSVLISQSKDGDFIAGVVHGMKGRTVRGSTSKGGFSAIKGLLRSIRENYAVVTTPDGPRGPKYKFQSGTLYISSMGKIPIVPISCSFDNAWVFKSWDNFMIPKPFSRVFVSIGQPVQIPADVSEDQNPDYQKNLEDILANLSPEFIE